MTSGSRTLDERPASAADRSHVGASLKAARDEILASEVEAPLTARKNSPPERSLSKRPTIRHL